MNACPCGSARAYADCCGRLHAGAEADHAEALMRARYSAYVRADARFLLASWLPRTRPAALDFSAAAATRWLGLEVRRHQLLDDDHAIVEFVARYKVGGAPAVRQHETSRFVREHGHWYYCDGEIAAR